jgi:hypothetical protein
MCEHIQKFTRENNDKIIMGFGASNHCVAEKRLIAKNELNRACPERLIFIVKYDHHACLPRRGCKSAPSSASRSRCNRPF